jgi:hypothetical protein
MPLSRRRGEFGLADELALARRAAEAVLASAACAPCAAPNRLGRRRVPIADGGAAHQPAGRAAFAGAPNASGGCSTTSSNLDRRTTRTTSSSPAPGRGDLQAGEPVRAAS